MRLLAFAGVTVIALMAFGLWLMWREVPEPPPLYAGYQEVPCEGQCGGQLMILATTPKPYMCWRCFHDKAYLRRA